MIEQNAQNCSGKLLLIRSYNDFATYGIISSNNFVTSVVNTLNYIYIIIVHYCVLNIIFFRENFC